MNWGILRVRQGAKASHTAEASEAINSDHSAEEDNQGVTEGGEDRKGPVNVQTSEAEQRLKTGLSIKMT